MNRKRLIHTLNITFALLPLAAMLAGCSDRPKNILSEKDMVAVMTDMQIAEAYNRSQYGFQDGAPSATEMGDGILAAHGVTRAEFDSTLMWYGRNLDQYDKLYQKIDRNLANRARRLAKESGDVSADNLEKGNMWPYATHYLLTPKSATDALSFSIPANDMVPGEQLEWRMRVPSGESMNIVFGVEYDNRSLAYSYSTQSSTQNVNGVKVQTDTAKNVVRIFGIARPSGSTPQALRIDSISLIREPFDSLSYERIRFLKTKIKD